MKAAVIGCGRMGAEPSSRLAGIAPIGWLPISHAESLLSIPELQLAALCDVDAARVEARGRHYGVDALFTDYRQLLANVSPQIVTIATRTPGKIDIIRAACEHGARVIYVEKPLANDLNGTIEALNAVRDANVILGYGVNRRYHAVYRRAREFLRAGGIGEILEVTVDHGRGQLLWTHPHSTDLALFLLDQSDFTTVQARFARDSVDRKSDRLIDSDPLVEHAHFTFPNGTSATISRAGGTSVHVAGTSGTLTVHGDGAYIQISAPNARDAIYFHDQRLIHQQPRMSATVTALMELIAAADGAAPPITRDEILAGMHMLLAAAWSHLEDGRAVRPGETPADLRVSGRTGQDYA